MSFLKVPEIDVHELARKLGSDEAFVLLDVREAWELDQAMITDSRLKVVPVSRLAGLGLEALPEQVQQKDTEIRSAQVAEWMIARGWTHVSSVRGGIDDYARQVDASVGKY